MEKYIEPEMELVTFDSEDVIMTSDKTIPGYSGPVIDNEDDAL